MSDITRNGDQQAVLLEHVFIDVVTYMPQLMLPLLNSVFGTEFTGDERVEQEAVEIYEPDEQTFTVREDTVTTVTKPDGTTSMFHVSAQAGDDREIIFHTYVYDMQVAFKKSVIEGHVVTAPLLDSAVVCLRPAESNAKKLTYGLLDPETDERVHKRKINMLYVPDMTVDEIFAGQLYALLPFYLLTHGDNLSKMERSEEGREALIREAKEIADRIVGVEALAPEQQLRLLELIGVVARALLEGETATEISGIMQGYVQELDIDKMHVASKTDGMTQGV